MKKFLVIFFLTLFGLLIAPFFVFASTNSEIDQLNQQIAEKQVQIKKLEQSIADYKNKVKQQQQQKVSLSNQMAIINNRISQVTLDIEATKIKLDSVALEIQTLQLGILNKEKTVAKQKIILAELIRNIRFDENKKYLEIAAGYKSFSDFYNRLQYLQTVDRELGRTAKTIRLAKEDLEAQKEIEEQRQQTYNEFKDQLQDKKSDLTDQSTVKKNLLEQTQQSEAKFKALLASLTKQYQQIEGEVEYIEKIKRQKLEDQDKLNKLSDTEQRFSWPMPSHSISATFHDPDYPYRRVFEHNGIDIRGAQGTAVRASGSGYIGQAKFCNLASCYSYVMIIHANGLATVYGHLSKIRVAVDQFVTRGDIIGYSGGTPGTVGAGPFVTGPHLHFEVRLNGIPVNPINYLE